MYLIGKKKISNKKANEIDTKNHEIWNNFWNKPRSERTNEDLEKLLEIQIMVRA